MVNKAIVILFALQLSACATAKLNCDESCGLQGQICRGAEMSRDSETVFTCANPTSSDEKLQAEAGAVAAEREIKHASDKRVATWVGAGLGVAGSVLLFLVGGMLGAY